MTTDTRETVTLTRICNASIQRVFQAWIDPALMKRWWTPNPDWNTGAVEIDARVGGSFSVEFGPTGEPPLVERGTYLEFDPPHRIVYTEHVVRGEETLHGPAPCTVTFHELADGTTEVTVVSTLEPGEEPGPRTGGWSAALDLLAAVFATPHR